MKISSMSEFQDKCRVEYILWNHKFGNTKISFNDTFVVWSCKALQNWKCIISNKVDNTLAEYTFNGDKGELYEDVYKKLSNRCIME
jgi:hypothetical protein